MAKNLKKSPCIDCMYSYYSRSNTGEQELFCNYFEDEIEVTTSERVHCSLYRSVDNIDEYAELEEEFSHRDVEGNEFQVVRRYDAFGNAYDQVEGIIEAATRIEAENKALIELIERGTFSHPKKKSSVILDEDAIKANENKHWQDKLKPESSEIYTRLCDGNYRRIGNSNDLPESLQGSEVRSMFDWLGLNSPDEMTCTYYLEIHRRSKEQKAVWEKLREFAEKNLQPSKSEEKIEASQSKLSCRTRFDNLI